MPHMKKILNLVFLFIGFLAVGLGTVGIILPILPTTPFYLLACFCFAKGSPQFHKWFTGTKLYQKYLAEFVRTRAMTLKAKLGLCIPVSFVLWYSNGCILLSESRQYQAKYHLIRQCRRTHEKT